MTTTLAEVEQTDEDSPSPAQQALAAAVVLAAAAEAGVGQRVRAWLSGRISRVDLCYSAGQVVLQGMTRATLAAQHLAETEWNFRASPKVIASTEHERLVRAFDTITKEAQQVRADALAESLRSLAEPEVPKVPDEPDEPDDELEPFRTRASRIAGAEVVKAGRTAYGEAVDQAIGNDPDYVWRFEPDAGACARCVALAAQIFQSFEQAPKAGAHVDCACTLEAQYREG